MRPPRLFPLAAGLALLAATPAAREAPRAALGSPADSARVALLKSRLRQLVVAQESFFADHGTYTTHLAALGVLRSRSPGALRDSVWTQVIFASGRSWHGRVIHLGAQDTSCVIYVGLLTDFPSRPVTEADSVRARNEGEPICDRL